MRILLQAVEVAIVPLFYNTNQYLCATFEATALHLHIRYLQLWKRS
jgi:hypothetical protein